MKTVKCVSVVLLILAAGIGARVNCQSRAPQFQPPAGWWNPVVPPDKSFTIEMPGKVEHTHDPIISFRFEGDRIAELWDVGQVAPADSPNEYGMF
jgi:hypothetical protein